MYVENGRPTRGEWYVDDDGHFASFWPPSYRARYDFRWMVEDGAIVGLRSGRAPHRRRREPARGVHCGWAGERVHDIVCSASPGVAPSASLSRVQTFMLMTIPMISRISSCEKCSASAA
jgi:hypothetical protein